MEFEDVIKKRASIRSYGLKKVNILDIIDCIQIANTAPSPGNLPLLKYIIVEDPKLKEEIAQACQQPYILNAQFLVVICSNSSQAEIMYDKRAKKYVTQHAGAAIENLLLRITDLGLATCWIGAFSERTVKDSLNIPDSIEIEAILPIGYQPKSDHTKQRKKLEIDGRLYFEKYGNKFKRGKEIMRRADI